MQVLLSRNNVGSVLCLFSFHIGFQDAICAELMAIDKASGLFLSNPMLRGHSIEIVSDCLNAVEWINGDNVGSIDHINLIYGIRDALRIHGRAKICCCPRASNSIADALAKRGALEGGDFCHWGTG